MQLSLRRLIQRLKQIDADLWVAMGSPAPTYFTKFRNYTTSRPAGFNTPPTEYSDLSMWLDQRCCERLRDTELSRNAVLYRRAGQVQGVVSVLVLCIILYARLH